MKIDYFEVQELAANILGMDIDNDDDYNNLDDALIERFNLDTHSLHDLIAELFDRLTLAISPLSNDAMIGFASENVWLIKKEITGNFINCVLHWMMEEKTMQEGEKWKREIINQKSRNVDFELIIHKPAATTKKGGEK